MRFLDDKYGADFQYSKDDVFNALLEAVQKIKNMKVDNEDRVSGFILIKTGVTLTSWGEKILFSVLNVSPGHTRVEILSPPKTGIFGGGDSDIARKQFIGINLANIEKILEVASKILAQL